MTMDWISISQQVFNDRLDAGESYDFEDSSLMERALELVCGPVFGSQWSNYREPYLED